MRIVGNFGSLVSYFEVSSSISQLIVWQTSCIKPSATKQSARRGSHSLNHAEVNHAPGSCSHYGDFVQASFNMEDRTAEFPLGVSKASAKAFEPRIS